MLSLHSSQKIPNHTEHLKAKEKCHTFHDVILISHGCTLIAIKKITQRMIEAIKRIWRGDENMIRSMSSIWNPKKSEIMSCMNFLLREWPEKITINGGVSVCISIFSTTAHPIDFKLGEHMAEDMREHADT